mmetsp:Transcript_71673/g.87896  ORF Transcript_71673/g.87896 Transcript_71673/m.87896 type:complete len:273 (-) Transcript_71673:170-988(-)
MSNKYKNKTKTKTITVSNDEMNACKSCTLSWFFVKPNKTETNHGSLPNNKRRHSNKLKQKKRKRKAMLMKKRRASIDNDDNVPENETLVDLLEECQKMKGKHDKKLRKINELSVDNTLTRLNKFDKTRIEQYFEESIVSIRESNKELNKILNVLINSQDKAHNTDEVSVGAFDINIESKDNAYTDTFSWNVPTIQINKNNIPRNVPRTPNYAIRINGTPLNTIYKNANTVNVPYSKHSNGGYGSEHSSRNNSVVMVQAISDSDVKQIVSETV